ncbi:MAG: hypothetical protein ACOCR6_01075 [archaeon]
MSLLKTRPGPTLPGILAGGGSILLLLSFISNFALDWWYYSIEAQTNVRFALHRLGNVIGNLPLLSIPFVIGSIGIVIGALVVFRYRFRGAKWITAGFGFTLVPIIVGHGIGWIAVGESWALLLLPGTVIANLSVTVDRDAIRLPIVTFPLAVGISIGIAVITAATVGLPSRPAIFILITAAMVFTIFVVATTAMVRRIDSGVTAVAAFAGAFFGSMILHIFEIATGRHLLYANTDPIFFAILLFTAGVIVVAHIVVDLNKSGKLPSNQSLQVLWGFVFFSGWSYGVAARAVLVINSQTIRTWPAPEIETQLWPLLATVSLFVFILAFTSATWFTFGDRLSIKT